MLFLERLRAPQDRQHLLGLYQSCWGHPLPLLSIPELSISPEGVELGLAKLPRIQAQTDTHAGESVYACINTPGFGLHIFALHHTLTVSALHLKLDFHNTTPLAWCMVSTEVAPLV